MTKLDYILLGLAIFSIFAAFFSLIEFLKSLNRLQKTLALHKKIDSAKSYQELEEIMKEMKEV